jgi:uncharacterized protein
MLIDANLLVYAVDSSAVTHERSKEWLGATLNGPERVGIAWSSLLGFLRLTTNPRVTARPLTMIDSWRQVQHWLALENVWVPTPTSRHGEILGRILGAGQLSANHVPDAHLAALAVEHGLVIYSNDSDFARFTEVRWVNPISASS